MPSTKQQAINLIENLPEDTSFDDIMEELFFSKKVQQGISDLDNNAIVSHVQVLEEIGKWRKK
ncbi:hypothetical protein ND861_18745 [Leptospira sp. 2 VSF19]|uniref:Toxin-antitoxin system, antitoxin component, ribbon-helix-helix domain protein n=1 Tax=Leptospira soteropolitanensis TaxID=2950025 RepID=A0AAW5VRH9_9LEPT|nr:hypothetical protein [Leptospira soteropolitanensis]MCW7494704.1 hypothetical protein [Leptospira soteropolitanensis]MCW7502305.1 hypothetical protein [Leptospira soteropolitanensis]MCW7524541.1 hypothetical protein [Leptospira soteropolitanensis]MCW7528403.1 hypothetical protein [Leptospira soteropolitanensis]MCW7532271.1 hypothetical protein [Leptospira soteropolitanensis]